MTADELEDWFQRHREPAVPLEAVPDREAMTELIKADRAVLWADREGVIYAACTAERVARQKRHSNSAGRRLQVETDAMNQYGRLDSMASQSVDACDPGLIAMLREVAAVKTVKWERFGNRHIPSPVVILTGCQPWPPAGTKIVRARAGARRIKVLDGHVCPTCRGLPLGPVAFCGTCDRWGLDHLRQRAGEAQASKRVIKFEPRTRKGKAG